jgi:small neutral amino acid transporter SnatA (MarC family)
VLGTSVSSFQIGGGLIVLLIGLSLVQGKQIDASVNSEPDLGLESWRLRRKS